MNVALRKFIKPMSVSEARDYVKAILQPICQHYPDTSFFDRALLAKAEFGYSLYDTLMITAALDLGCHALITEDLHHGQVIRGMKIINPFRES
jgi:predicted nucleic acid-binding protein